MRPNKSLKNGFPVSIFEKRADFVLALFSFFGFLDSFYLTFEHYRGANVNCIINSGCDKVLSSEYAFMFGVPLPLIGVIYYLFVFSMTLFFLFGHSENFFKIALAVSPIGFLASLWFVFLQIFVIKYICLYCMISAFTSTVLFLTALALFVKFKIKQKEALVRSDGNNPSSGENAAA